MAETWMYGAVSASFFLLTLVGTLVFKNMKTRSSNNKPDSNAVRQRAQNKKLRAEARSEKALAEQELMEAERARRERRDKLRAKKS